MATSGGQSLGARANRTGGPETLRRTLEDLGLSPSEARVLLALLRTGSSNSSQLARLAGVPRTSTYPVLEALSAKGLVHRVPSEGPTVWATPGPDEVLERLETAWETAQAEQLREYRDRVTDARLLLAEAIPENPSVALPHVHFVPGAPQVRRAFERLLGEARRELLMFNVPPYTWDPEIVNLRVMQMLERGVETRVLYQGDQWEDPAAERFRASHQAYHRAGVEPRLVDALPVKLAVADRRIGLVGMRGQVDDVDGVTDAGFPTNVLIEDPGMAELLALGFEMLWSTGRMV